MLAKILNRGGRATLECTLALGLGLAPHFAQAGAIGSLCRSLLGAPQPREKSKLDILVGPGGHVALTDHAGVMIDQDRLYDHLVESSLGVLKSTWREDDQLPVLVSFLQFQRRPHWTGRGHSVDVIVLLNRKPLKLVYRDHSKHTDTDVMVALVRNLVSHHRLFKGDLLLDEVTQLYLRATQVLMDRVGVVDGEADEADLSEVKDLTHDLLALDEAADAAEIVQSISGRFDDPTLVGNVFINYMKVKLGLVGLVQSLSETQANFRLSTVRLKAHEGLLRLPETEEEYRIRGALDRIAEVLSADDLNRVREIIVSDTLTQRPWFVGPYALDTRHWAEPTILLEVLRHQKGRLETLYLGSDLFRPDDFEDRMLGL